MRRDRRGIESTGCQWSVASSVVRVAVRGIGRYGCVGRLLYCSCAALRLGKRTLNRFLTLGDGPGLCNQSRGQASSLLSEARRGKHHQVIRRSEGKAIGGKMDKTRSQPPRSGGRDVGRERMSGRDF